MKYNQWIKRLVFGGTCVALSMAMVSCLNENSSSFGFLSRNSTSQADLTDETQNPDGSITVIDTWQNLQEIAKKATILITVDASGSLDDEVEFLADKGIKALVERFASEFETYFAVTGGFTNHAPYSGYNNGTQTVTNRVTLSNGMVVNDPAGKIWPPNNLDQACVSVNDYATTQGVVNAVKANFALRPANDNLSQKVGAGEAMVNSVKTLFTTPSLINPIVNTGKCFGNDHTIIVVSMSDETDYTLCPKDYSLAQNAVDPSAISQPNTRYTWEYWDLDEITSNFNFDADCGSDTSREYAGDTVGAMLSSTYNSVTNTWEMNDTIDSVEADLRAFAGTLPFFWATVGYDQSGYAWNTYESPAYAELALSERFSDSGAYHIPMEYATDFNESAFSAAFNNLAEQLKSDASYLNIFDTQSRCPGTTVVKVDGVTLEDSKYIELSPTRVTIKSPHNQGTEVTIEYALNTGAGSCD
ncbi:MAG TPA: hypothetical protein PKC21_06310 [Oligoflexia bacterium]|nr:hypothetical protein [Oligoflexia bacterium]HMR24948.1 hypothetical protein [Oligoflexia bacterium]